MGQNGSGSEKGGGCGGECDIFLFNSIFLICFGCIVRLTVDVDGCVAKCAQQTPDWVWLGGRVGLG